MRWLKKQSCLSQSRISRWGPPVSLFLVHMAVSLYYKHRLGVDIEIDHPRNTWNFFWQTLSLEHMEKNILASLWYFHAQPPLFNVYGYVLNKLFGPFLLQAMQYFQILLGSAISAMLYSIVHSITKRPVYSFVCVLLISMNPSIFLYEAFILYSLPVAFLVTLSVFLLSKHDQTRSMLYPLLFIATVNILILTRSLFHVALLIPFVTIGAFVVGKKWRRFLLYACLISLVSIGWYFKNHVLFGFFGSSSWMGSNLWRNVSQNYSREELEAFYRQGVIHEAVLEKQYFDPPLTYKEFGFDAISEIPVLDSDDYNNINMIAISRSYLEASKSVIRLDPIHYLNNSLEAYGRFCNPSFDTSFVARNMALISRHAKWWAYIQGDKLFGAEKGGWVTTFYSLLIPAGILMLGVRFCLVTRGSLRKLPIFIRQEGLLTTIVVYVAYVTLVASFFEYGENCRFKFSIESIFLAYIFGMVGLGFAGLARCFKTSTVNN